MQSMDRIQKTIALSLLAILLGAAAYNLEVRKVFSEFNPQPEEAGATPAGAPPQDFIVADQAPGGAVRIAAVNFDEPGWVAIRENKNGEPANIIGAKRFEPGKHQNGSVELLRQTKEGSVYFAALYRDDGDRAFDYKKDAPVTDASGNPVLVRFVASASHPE